MATRLQKPVKASSYWADILRRFMKNRIAVLGGTILFVIIILCMFAPLFTSHDPILSMDLQNTFMPPNSPNHLLGTDELGRDIWSRLIYGGRTSLSTGILVVVLAASIGIIVGLVSGYYGGWLESILMRFTDIMLSFPFLIISIAILAALGSSERNIIIALAITSWPRFARLTRGQVLSLKQSEYVEAARVAGFENRRIIFTHILPNCMPPLIVQITLQIGKAILAAASLKYLGLGTDAAAPDWGVMLNQSKEFLQSSPYLTLIPGIAISVTVLAINWIGDGLRDAFDPKIRK